MKRKKKCDMMEVFYNDKGEIVLKPMKIKNSINMRRVCMKFINFVVFLVILSFMNMSCVHIKGNGVLATNERILSLFEKVHISGNANVRFHTGTEYRAVITIDSNLEEYVVLEIKNNVLEIYLKKGRSYSYTNFTVDIYSPFISSISISGSGSFEGIDKIITRTFDSSISGSGKISGDIESESVSIRISGSGEMVKSIICNNLSVEISGNGNIFLTGTGNLVDTRISGSGNFNGMEFQCNNVNARINGSGNINIWAIENITANISGAGNIRYRGNPKINYSGSGSGKIISE